MPRAVYPSMAEDSRMGTLRLHSICRGRLPTDRKSTRRQASFFLSHSPSCPAPPPRHPATRARHSREGGNLDARSYDVCRDRIRDTMSFPRRRESGRARCYGIFLKCAALRRLPHRPGAEEGGAGGDEQAAGKEEQQQQPARYPNAASSRELVGRNGRRGGRGRGRGHRRASWRHRWRWCGRGRPGRHDVI